MKHPDVILLEKLFGKHPGARPRLLPPDATPAPGQMWAITGATAQHLFGEVILLGCVQDEDGLTVIDVAPLVHDAALAGPMDYILPENILCHHSAVLLSLSFSLPQGKLGACIGAIEELLFRDLLAHYDKSQVKELALNERHAPAYFDAQDARYRFHEEAAGQIAILQRDIYQWLDKLEDDGEWIIPEGKQDEELIPVIDAAALFREVAPAYGMAAAGAEMLDRLKPFDVPCRINGKPARLEVRQSAKTGYLVLVIHGDPDRICAKILSSTGAELAKISDAQARFEWSDAVGGSIAIADAAGAPIVVLKLQ